MGKNCNFVVHRLSITGLSLFLLVNILYTSSSPPAPSPSTLSLPSQSALNNAEPVDAVALCKAGVIKYTPLGAYPGGSDDVKATLNYCKSLRLTDNQKDLTLFLYFCRTYTMKFLVKNM